ncbi:MAG: hypothetical protein ISS93_02635 [Candidatus Aenigmarchaeota archaeon]|nr:hypothetical protein [Candidatus Aenigmarchaeota archaeon]
MDYYNEVSYRGEVWRYIYLESPGFFILPPEDHHKVMERAVEMHVDNKKKLPVKGDDFEGTVYTHGESGLVGSFFGQCYYCDFESERGNGRIKVLAEPINGRGLLPAGSRN